MSNPDDSDNKFRKQFEYSMKELVFLAQNETQLKMVRIAKQNAEALIAQAVTKAQIEARIDEMIKLDATKFNCDPEWVVHGYATDRIKELEGEKWESPPRKNVKRL